MRELVALLVALTMPIQALDDIEIFKYTEEDLGWLRILLFQRK
jgi:hypothetical protein